MEHSMGPDLFWDFPVLFWDFCPGFSVLELASAISQLWSGSFCTRLSTSAASLWDGLVLALVYAGLLGVGLGLV